MERQQANVSSFGASEAAIHAGVSGGAEGGLPEEVG